MLARCTLCHDGMSVYCTARHELLLHFITPTWTRCPGEKIQILFLCMAHAPHATLSIHIPWVSDTLGQRPVQGESLCYFLRACALQCRYILYRCKFLHAVC
jgi:hypothetical protein